MSDQNKIVELFYSPNSNNVHLAICLIDSQGIGNLECLVSMRHLEEMDKDGLLCRIHLLERDKKEVPTKFYECYIDKVLTWTEVNPGLPYSDIQNIINRIYHCCHCIPVDAIEKFQSRITALDIKVRDMQQSILRHLSNSKREVGQYADMLANNTDNE